MPLLHRITEQSTCHVCSCMAKPDQSHTALKGEIWYTMDLGYIWYDNELECLFGSKKAHIDTFLSLLFLADSTKRYKLGEHSL